MTALTLVLQEIRQRLFSFLPGVLAIALATGVVTASFSLLEAHDRETALVLQNKQQEVQKEMDAMEDEYRKITKKMGFNILILPKAQTLADFYSDHQATHFMPEESVKKLAAATITTIEHLLPLLQQKITWPELGRTVILVGVRGEVPFMHRGEKNPILYPVPPGTVVLGHELATSRSFAVGNEITLMGRRFKIHAVNPPRGGKDDITLWINLSEAQELLGKPGLITGIMALQCKCAFADLPKVQAEVESILPDTQAIEFATQAQARAEARQQARKTAEQVIAQWKAGRDSVRDQIKSYATAWAPIVMAGCFLGVAAMAHSNARERRQEVGILSAIGISQGNIFAIFLLRAAIQGLLGSLGGFIAGIALTSAFSSAAVPLNTSWMLVPAWLAPSLLLATPTAAALAALVPAAVAVQADPANILGEE